MDGKTNEKYQMMFDLLVKAVGSDFMDRNFTFMGDFEIAHFNFLRDKVTRKNCLFHYCQCIYRKCQYISKIEYENKTSFYELAKSLMILPYVSPNRVVSIFDMLKNEYKSENEKELLKYFEENFLNGSFKLENWNLHDTIIRTNNQIESFHSAFNRFVNQKHPKFHNLVPKINKQIIKNKKEYDEQVKNMRTRRKKTEFILKNKNLYLILLEESKYKDNELVILLKNATKNKREKYEMSRDPTEREEEKKKTKWKTFRKKQMKMK